MSPHVKSAHMGPDDPPFAMRRIYLRHLCLQFPLTTERSDTDNAPRHSQHTAAPPLLRPLFTCNRPTQLLGALGKTTPLHLLAPASARAEAAMAILTALK